MTPIEIGKVYEPAEQNPRRHVRREVLATGETTLGTKYVAFVDLIEIRGVGVVSREDFEDWRLGRGLARWGDGGDD